MTGIDALTVVWIVVAVVVVAVVIGVIVWVTRSQSSRKVDRQREEAQDLRRRAEAELKRREADAARVDAEARLAQADADARAAEAARLQTEAHERDRDLAGERSEIDERLRRADEIDPDAGDATRPADAPVARDAAHRDLPPGEDPGRPGGP